MEVAGDTDEQTDRCGQLLRGGLAVVPCVPGGTLFVPSEGPCLSPGETLLVPCRDLGHWVADSLGSIPSLLHLPLLADVSLRMFLQALLILLIFPRCCGDLFGK